jgi:mRNA interferase ChpB
MIVFDRGDIVRANLNPTSGREITGDFRPCLVLSKKEFNRLGMTLIAPITQGGDFARHQGFAVTLTGCGSVTQGVVLVNGLRMVDLAARNGKKVEHVPQVILDEAFAKIEAILE